MKHFPNPDTCTARMKRASRRYARRSPHAMVHLFCTHGLWPLQHADDHQRAEPIAITSLGREKLAYKSRFARTRVIGTNRRGLHLQAWKKMVSQTRTGSGDAAAGAATINAY